VWDFSYTKIGRSATDILPAVPQHGQCSWAGPGKGVVSLPAEEWHPYSPFTFVTPPFPGFPSGHSTVSSAAARILELFTGSNRFGDKEKRMGGFPTEPGFKCAIIQMQDGKLPKGHEKLTCDVVLLLPTFQATAKMAGISRVMGGYHIQAARLRTTSGQR
jgi:hypothetical protein